MKKTKSEKDRWLEYERRKAGLQRQNLTPKEYEQAIQRLAEELGV